MKPRIAAICAIVTFATCGDRAPAQFPDCAYITLFNPCPVSSETRGDCKPIIDPQVLGCSLPAPQPHYTWSIEDCQPHSEQVFVREELRLLPSSSSPTRRTPFLMM